MGSLGSVRSLNACCFAFLQFLQSVEESELEGCTFDDLEEVKRGGNYFSVFSLRGLRPNSTSRACSGPGSDGTGEPFLEKVFRVMEVRSGSVLSWGDASSPGQ